MDFLITHPGVQASEHAQYSAVNLPIRIMFDLCLQSRLEIYIPEQQNYLDAGRRPYRLGPGVATPLVKGGLNPDTDVDLVILSHVHYDHHGDH
jgi:ribonuclease BN (tRNA processing enzyme)